MKSAQLPENEAERLAALREYALLDTPPEADLDELTRLASGLTGAPVALISLVDERRQWFKSRVGFNDSETPRDIAFCAHAILQDDVFAVPDARKDERFHDNPLVSGPDQVRFYAGQPLRTPEGLPLGTLCVLDHEPRELTPQQLELLRILGKQVMAQFELRRVLSQLARAHGELLELSALKDNFMRIASHDLKNPLTVLLGAAQMLEQMLSPGQPVTEAEHELALMLKRTALSMQRIIEDFLDFRAVSDGRLALRRRTLDLNALAAEVVAGQQEYARAKGVELEFQGDPGLVPWQADPERLRQVMTNLVGNALKFSLAGTATIVRLRGEGPDAVFEVLDEGPGLRDEDQPRLFQRYARLSNKPTGTESSSGIGLYICKQLVELHGGTIGAENRPEGGSRFWFSLPPAPASTEHAQGKKP